MAVGCGSEVVVVGAAGGATTDVATNGSSVSTGGGGGAGGIGGVVSSSSGSGGANGVPCPDEACEPGSWCLLCKDENGQELRLCRDNLDWPTDVCPQLFGWGPLYMKCDGPEDCAATEICGILPGSLGTYAECYEAAPCAADCSCGEFEAGVCHTLADCPGCAMSCEAPSPELPIATCQ